MCPVASQVVNEPYRNFKYLVEIDGFSSAGFSKCSGLDMEHEVTEYREGGENTVMRKMPGQTKFSPIVLERGSTTNLDMWAWAKAVHSYGGVAGSAVVRKTISIVLVGDAGARLREWTVTGAWVSKWEMGELDAKSNDVLVERITIQHEGVDQVGTPIADNAV
jgi:phage tail-like protein